MNSPKYIILAAVMVLTASAANAATVTVTNCTGPQVTKQGKKTLVNFPADDIIITCPLMALTNTDKIEITGASITIDGSAPDVGSVTAPGKGMALILNASGPIVIDDADIISANANGKLDIIAGGNISITDGSHLQSGDQMHVSCTGANCTITVNGTTIDGNQVFFTSDGTTLINPTTSITTHCPRDLIVIVSNHGSVLLAGAGLGLGTACCQQALATCANPQDPDCPFAQPNGQICLNTPGQLQSFCAIDCERSPNTFQQCIEGNIIISAPTGSIDLTDAVLHAGEAITLTALLDVNMTNAKIDNCGPKTGFFTVNSATCNVQGATLKDDSPQTAPTLNCTVSGTATLLGTCSNQAQP